jgi:general secretion pathway protein A
MFQAFYGLSANPFLLNPDPSFYFESQGHRKARVYLKYGAFQGEGFLVMTGDIGAGKTTLVRTLVREFDPNLVLVAQLVSTQLEADDLLRAVALAFGQPVEGATKAALLATIENFLSSLVRQRRHALLIIDEAQNLGPRAMEELRMLSNFQIGNQSMLQCMLVGQPELRTLMGAPSLQQLRERVIASCHLGPLEADETRAYIEHRLEHAGWKGDPSIDSKVFDAVHEWARGIPRRINTLCSRLLLRGYLARGHEINVVDVTEAIEELAQEIGMEVPIPATQASAAVDEGGGRDSAPAPEVASISGRLDRLERSVHAVLELVRAISSQISRSREGGRK